MLKFYKAKVETLPDKEKFKEIEGAPAEKFFRLAMTLPAIKDKASNKIIEMVLAANKEYRISENFPIAVPILSDPKKVAIFPNIKAKASAEVVLDGVIKVIREPRTKMRLAEPDRAVKLALKREVTTFAKLIADYTNIKELGMPDDVIRALSEKVSAAFQEPKIVWCKTPKDYFTMYGVKVGYSCMAHGSTYCGDWSAKTWMEVAKDTGFYPSSWYGFLPHAKGGMLMVQGKPVVRFMVYRTDLSKDEYPLYGDVKYETPAYSKICTDMLEKMGKKSTYRVATIADFEVPAVYHKALWDGKIAGCPLPFHDNQADDYSFAWDKDNDQFLFGPSSKHPEWTKVKYHYDWRGWIGADKIYQIPSKEKVEEPAAKGVIDSPRVAAAVAGLIAEEAKPKRAPRKKAVPVEVELPKAEPAKRVRKVAIPEEVEIVKPIEEKVKVVADNPYLIIIG